MSKQLKKIVQNTDPKVILACADICDGHTIFKPETFIEKGLDKRVVENYTKTHLSDPDDYKQQITGSNGKQLEQLRGVYGLALLYGLAAMLEVEYEGKLGRGSQARVIQEALHNKLEKKV